LLKAPGYFGQKSNKSHVVVALPYRSSCSCAITIPHGFAAIVTRFGKCVGVYKAGWYWLPAWYKVVGLVNTQYIPYHFSVKECPTRDNVPIKIHVDLMFTIKDPITFFYDIGPEKLEELLRASQAESVRSLARSIKVSQAYDLRGQESEDVVKSLNDKLNPYGVHIEFITIANITLPANIAMTLQSETAFFSKQMEQKKKQEYELKVLNDSNYSLRIQQDRKNERKRVRSNAEKQIALISQDIQGIEVKSTKILGEMQATQDAEVSKLTAQGRLEANKIDANKDKSIMETKANGAAQVALSKALIDKYTKEVKSAARVTVAQNNSQAIEYLGTVEAETAEKLKYKRKYNIQMETIELWNELAKNTNVFISAETEQVTNVLNNLYAAHKVTGLLNA